MTGLFPETTDKFLPLSPQWALPGPYPSLGNPGSVHLICLHSQWLPRMPFSFVEPHVPSPLKVLICHLQLDSLPWWLRVAAATPLRNRNKPNVLPMVVGLVFGHPLSQHIVMISMFFEGKLFSIKLKSPYRLAKILKDVGVKLIRHKAICNCKRVSIDRMKTLIPPHHGELCSCKRNNSE